MARRKDDPELQAAKGFPGRRRKKVEAEIQAAKGFPGRRRKKVEAEIQAAVDSAEEATPISTDLPKFFSDAPSHWRVATSLWIELVETLRSSGRWRPGYRSALARYCALSQKWTEAMDQMRRDLPKGGVTVKVVKGDGNTVFRTHPSVDFMGKVGVELRLMEHEFGFTPRSDTDMTRVETFNASQGRLPLQGGGMRGQPERKTEAGAQAPDPMSLMADTDSPPPGTVPN